MSVNEIVCILLTVYWVILIVRIIASWFPVPMSGPFRKALNFVYDVTEPVMRPLRQMIPPVRLGVMGLDLSPIIIFVVIAILRRFIC